MLLYCLSLCICVVVVLTVSWAVRGDKPCARVPRQTLPSLSPSREWSLSLYSQKPTKGRACSRFIQGDWQPIPGLMFSESVECEKYRINTTQGYCDSKHSASPEESSHSFNIFVLCTYQGIPDRHGRGCSHSNASARTFQTQNS